MGYIPYVKNDIFISYRHVANDDYVHWVDVFRERLQAKLQELVGNVVIWRDKDAIRAGDQWRPEIADALEQTAIFLAIISRTYFDPGVCPEELDRFLKQAQESGDAKKRLIVPIFKQPPKSEDDVPRELAGIHHHQFFQWNPPGTHNFREFRPGKGTETDGQFCETLERLAQDLMYQIEALNGRAKEGAVGKIFLASVAPELHDEREKLRSDLQQRGYVGVPEYPYLWNSSGLEERLTADLAEAELCVHLLPSHSSNEPETHERARRQLELATKAMKDKGKPPPLVWIQPAAEVDAGARTVIDYVERELTNEGVEYSRGALEDFKTQILDKLPRAQARTGPSAVREVALLLEGGDLEAAGEVRRFLTNQLNLDAVPVKFAGASPADPSFLADTLKQGERCIIYWGGQGEDWVYRLLRLDALAGHLGEQKLCVYAAAPATPEKSAFLTAKARTVLAASGVNEAELRRFLAA